MDIMQITSENCIEYLLHTFPGFQEEWNRHLAFWEGEKPGLCMDISAFATYVERVIQEDDSLQLHNIFEVVELCMCSDDEELKTAFTTCFLENLLNCFSSGKIDASVFVPLLGEKSRQYCRAWNDFTGVKTPGI